MKIIHQIYITDGNYPPSSIIQEKMDNVKLLYNDHDYFLYNNDDLTKIISENFKENILRAYKSLLPFAFKADLARLCLLYLYGGYYFDVAITPLVKMEFEEDLVFIRGDSETFEIKGAPIIENNFMFAKKPNNIILLELIYKIAHNVKHQYYGEHPLAITSPLFIGKALEKIEHKEGIKFGKVRFDNDEKVAYVDNTLFYKFKPKFSESDLSKLGARGTNNYAKMWFDRNVFAK